MCIELPASSTPEIQPQLNGQRDNSTVATIQPPSGMDVASYMYVYSSQKSCSLVDSYYFEATMISYVPSYVYPFTTSPLTSFPS